MNCLVNRCVHKGSTICYHSKGRRDRHHNFVCPYHNWIYDFDGNLTSVAFEKGVQGRGGMLEDRVTALREVNVYEPHVYRHVIGPTEILERKDGSWHTQTSYLLARIMQDGETQLFSTGRYVDAIAVEGGAARFSIRIVVTDSWRYDMLIVIPI